MVNNYYTLWALVKELRKTFSGKTIEEIYSQERNTLTISFQETSSAILVYCEPNRNALIWKPNVARARKNTVNLLTDSYGSVLCSIDLTNGSREVVCSLSSGLRLVVQLFGSKANVLLVQAENIIVDAFLRKDEMISKEYEGSELLEDAPSIKKDITFSNGNESETVFKVIKEQFPALGSLVVREVLFRSGIQESILPNQLSSNERTRLQNALIEIQEELIEHPSPRIYFQEANPLCFSLIPLRLYGNNPCQCFDTVSEAIRLYLSRSRYNLQLEEKRKSILHQIENNLKQTEKTLAALEEQRSKTSSPDKLERFGTLILTYLNTISKGDAQIIVEDTLSEQKQEVSISLDPHLSPAKNAERYFHRARKARQTLVEIGAREEEFHKRKEELLKYKEILEQSSDVEEFVNEYGAALAPLGIRIQSKKEETREERIPFRVFTVSGGFKVYAGKSSENNDLLTTRYTGKDDLWFHVRGVGGSHVVLKVHSGKGEVSRKAVEEAAAIAAYYSKMKKASMVPVTMCKGKYVRKQKGAPPGTVVVEREETLFVEPRLPNEQKNENQE